MLTQALQEVIFVGLPGPTHNYGGLSADNVASATYRGNISRPREAALQALELVKLLKRLGITVGILPPQLRPHLGMLGGGEEAIVRAAKDNPALLEKASSSSAMWTANAATVTANVDAGDGRLHLTVANLHTNTHRRIEAEDTYRMLKAIFHDVPQAVVHPPLDASEGFRDEGAANHMRLAPEHGQDGLNIFVFGADGSKDDPKSARQTLAAFERIAADHRVESEEALFLKQNPSVIDAGVFHNDVIAVANESVLLVHEEAFADKAAFTRIEAAYKALHPHAKLNIILITSADLSVEEAVRTYFFNSQIVTLKRGANDGAMAIIAPREVMDLFGGKAASLMEAICNDPSNPIEEVHYVDLRQSMNNGGGPACLRLRVPMDEEQLASIQKQVNVIADDALLAGLEKIISEHYPAELAPGAIADPALYHQCRKVLGELGALMKLPLI